MPRIRTKIHSIFMNTKKNPCQNDDETILRVQAINRHRLGSDGKGITTLVALYPCHLKCKYCINNDILSKHTYKKYTPQSLAAKVMEDYCYFVATGGGITFGGGEPLLQIDSILKFRDELPEEVEINIETSLNICLTLETLEHILQKTDQLIIDIKSLDTVIYKEYTGRDNVHLLKNLNTVSELGYQNKCKIRIPQIPVGESLGKDLDTALHEEEQIKKMGFSHVEVFPYKIL